MSGQEKPSDRPERPQPSTGGGAARAREDQGEEKIGAVEVVLMDLDGKDVRALDQTAGSDRGAVPGASRAADGAVGQRQVVHRTGGGHVAAEDFDAVEMDDRAVVALDAQVQVAEGRRAGHGKRAAVVGGDVFVVGVGTV